MGTQIMANFKQMIWVFYARAIGTSKKSRTKQTRVIRKRSNQPIDKTSG